MYMKLSRHLTECGTSLLICCIAFCSCSPIEAYQRIMTEDMEPPGVVSVETVSSELMRITCTEKIRFIEDSCRIDPEMGCSEVSCEGETLTIRTEERMSAGSIYTLRISLADLSGNSIDLAAEVYGFNQSPPVLRINEFTARGSKKHPDFIELKAMSGGNLAGMCLFDGLAGSYRQRCLFSPGEVEEGDLIVVACSETPPGELSGLPEVLLFETDERKGLSGNNGVLSLYTSPTGSCMDCIVYSNRTSDSDENYEGFGSKAMSYRAHVLWDSGCWTSSVHGHCCPECAVFSDDMSATRSLCRTDGEVDTDTAGDWHTVPTSHSTPGTKNSEEQYE